MYEQYTVQSIEATFIPIRYAQAASNNATGQTLGAKNYPVFSIQDVNSIEPLTFTDYAAHATMKITAPNVTHSRKLEKVSEALWVKQEKAVFLETGGTSASRDKWDNPMSIQIFAQNLNADGGVGAEVGWLKYSITYMFMGFRKPGSSLYSEH